MHRAVPAGAGSPSTGRPGHVQTVRGGRTEGEGAMSALAFLREFVTFSALMVALYGWTMVG
ncbi:hypothetical protein [Azospirillum thermophilum]|uniref:hypothetical protein n=1 Tax=Azospirillum thermophilum TaxID=2202148 RepID=UPI0011B6C19C|nr:hypothetical protein [Azospirillum thermophilum]